jgi:magnesium transporter
MTETLDLAFANNTHAPRPGVVACALYRDGQRVRDIAIEEIGDFAGRDGAIMCLGFA